MTNSNDKYDTAERWENIKQRYLDRADVINELEEDELDAARSLRWSARSLAESVSNLLRLQYDDVVDFSDAYYLLKDQYNWDTSECEDKSKVMKMCSKIVNKLESEYFCLNMNDANRFLTKVADKSDTGMAGAIKDVEQFDNISDLMHYFFDTKPNQHQMKKFEEHGVTWEGEVDGH